ncbi:hypothetical protein TNCV_5059591 [Trichonephila clavipes]|nr:hypothetical protein TNCV_5059591 [Trichonephila clavipes]
MSENDEVYVEDIIHTPKISLSEGLKTAETELQYFEQQGASVMDLLFLRRLRDETANCRVQYGRQLGTTLFLKKKKRL